MSTKLIKTPQTRQTLLKKKLSTRSIYLLPNLLTSAALFSGFYAIVQAMNAHFEAAAISIFIAMLMDGLDGRVARITHTQSEFGAQYDSLSDMVSFGVAPALILYVWALKPLGKLGWIVAFIYCACVALRLARFNIQIEAETEYAENSHDFHGLPSPAAAGLLAGLVWVLHEYNISGNAILFEVIHIKWLALFITLFASLSMVSDIRYYSGKAFSIKDSVPFFVLLCLVLVLVLIAYSPPEVLFAISGIYAVSGHVIWLYQACKTQTR